MDLSMDDISELRLSVPLYCCCGCFYGGQVVEGSADLLMVVVKQSCLLSIIAHLTHYRDGGPKWTGPA